MEESLGLYLDAVKSLGMIWSEQKKGNWESAQVNQVRSSTFFTITIPTLVLSFWFIGGCSDAFLWIIHQSKSRETMLVQLHMNSRAWGWFHKWLSLYWDSLWLIIWSSSIIYHNRNAILLQLLGLFFSTMQHFLTKIFIRFSVA